MLNKLATVRKFRLAAKQRLTAAELLLRHRMYIDSKYLAGYSVECALKALIFARTADRAFSLMYARLTSGKKAHNYETLKGVLKRNPINLMIPIALAVGFLRVGSWDTSLRYQVGPGNAKETILFLDAAKEIVQWAENA